MLDKPEFFFIVEFAGPAPYAFATSIANLAALSNDIMLVAPVAQPGTIVSEVIATPTTGALVEVHGWSMLLI